LTPATQRLSFIIPNFVTCTGLCFGLAAIFLCFHNEFVWSAWLITLCVLLDKLDGTAARLLNASSKIGVELDSLSDFITFCVAPAILVSTALVQPGRPLHGMPLAIIAYASAATYVVAGAVRLAKFNCLEQQGEGLKRNFVGIPTTICGAFLATLMLVFFKYDLIDLAGPYMPAIMAICALSMVSTLLLPKLGKWERNWMNYFTMANAVIVPALILTHTCPEYLLGLNITYVFVGVIAASRPSYKVV
jgi:CDP-diacylglycerol---serine O-phosphatidyltransferase